MAPIGEFELADMAKIASLSELVARMPRPDPRFALFLGAGASVTSGIPAASVLMGTWKRTIFRDLMRFERFTPKWQTRFDEWLSCPQGRVFESFEDHTIPGYADWRLRAHQSDRHPSDYALLFSRTYPDEDARQGFIEALCDGAEPCAGYVYLASLVRDNVFRTLLTTNFDDLIHDAIFRYSGLKPAVCAFDSQVATVRMVAPRPKIIKLHGDFMYSSIRNVGTETARLDVNMRQKFEQTCQNYGLIVLGYSGQDRSVMDPIRSMLTQPGFLRHGLHWGVFAPRDALERGHGKVEVPEEVALLHRTYPERVHLYAVGTFDETMGAIARACRVDPPVDLTQPESRSNYARLREAITNAEQSWRLEPQFRTLLTSFREAQSRPLHPAVEQLDAADAAHNEGNALKKRGGDPGPKLAVTVDERTRLLGRAIQVFEQVNAVCSLVVLNRGKSSLQWPSSSAGPTGALSPPEGTTAAPVAEWRDEYLIWAYRRRTGGLTGICEAMFAAWSLDTIVRGEDPNRQAQVLVPAAEDRRRFVAAARGAWDDCCAGWAIARAQGFPLGVAGHTRNFAYNGLLATAYLLRVGVELGEEQRRWALEWLDHLTADRAFGAEFLAALRDEIGGAVLLERASIWGEPDVGGGVAEVLRAGGDCPTAEPAKVVEPAVGPSAVNPPTVAKAKKKRPR